MLTSDAAAAALTFPKPQPSPAVKGVACYSQSPLPFPLSHALVSYCSRTAAIADHTSTTRLPPPPRARASPSVHGVEPSLVHKKGVALGRSVDLTKFDGYDQLIKELDQLFEFKGELMAPNKNWMIVFTDNEDDMMLVGDDPWHGYVDNWCCIIFCGEFCAMVRKIFIYTKEEVQKMDSSTLNPKNEDCPDMKENVKETKGSQSASSSNSKNS
ncbi:hypothetical protein ZIOFF_013726 [Zingiber officinale]|uniref:Auxin-responsive protein n=1 Tax=Zingiber officinale TaxID=94328 RepID=A0A8J5HMY1_ZINOF|nr:hypothetical protein ZIOFF_013726 [Zingiber officinale]